MKNFIPILLLIILTTSSFAQKGINYKALVKDDSNNILSNQSITIEFSILRFSGGPGSVVVLYAETHTTTTDANGIVIANIGEGTPLNGFEHKYEHIDWGFGGHHATYYLNVKINSGSGFTDLGTTELNAVPFALYAENANTTGLELIEEEGDEGWRLKGMNPDFYGPIGGDAIDISFSWGSSATNGATGDWATALGLNTTASGEKSFAAGTETEASGTHSTAMGSGTLASGFNSTAMGQGTKATTSWSTALGAFNVGGALFEIGNGSDDANRKNALTVLSNGVVLAPTLEINEITDAKALVTKEYADANYSGGGGDSPTGLEKITNEGTHGWRLIGKNADNYGDIGFAAIDLSASHSSSSIYGATGDYSFSVGYQNTTSGNHSMSSGAENSSSGQYSATIGFSNTASHYYAIAIGKDNSASGQGSFVAGLDNEASGHASFASGNLTEATGNQSTAMGIGTKSVGDRSFALGNYVTATSSNSFVIGRNNVGGGNPDSWIESDPLFEIGNGPNEVQRSNALTVLKNGTITAPSFDISEITDAKSLITKEYFETNGSSGLEKITNEGARGWRLIGNDPANYGDIGYNAVDLSTSLNTSDSFGATGDYSFSVGYQNTASGIYSMSLGFGNISSGQYSTAIGYYNNASNQYSVAIGQQNSASGEGSFVTGVDNEVSGYASFASGNLTRATGNTSTAMGIGSQSIANRSFALGHNLTTNSYNSFAIGRFNIGVGTRDSWIDTESVFEIGNGSSYAQRSNALTVLKNGDATFGGTVSQNSDKRLKSNIEKLDHGLETVLKLKPVAYNWKSRPLEKEKTFGLIAQEVQPLIKEIVTIANDKDKTLSVSYTELIPILINAIKEQQAIINDQNNKIDNLTTEVKELETLNQRLNKIEAILNSQQ